MPTAIDVRNLTKTYPGRPPVEAVRGIDLCVEAGQCYGFLGPNGAGKTTTIEILEGLMQPTSGQVEIFGLQWNRQAHQIRQKIGVSLQDTQLSDKLSVRETVTLFRSFYSQGLDPDQAIEMVSLKEKSATWVKKLSGGQKQRLSIACAIVGNPQLVFLDEPTTGLDPSNRRQLWSIIQDFQKQGRTILLTTHYLEEAERLCDRVAIIDRGKIIAEGTPRELIAMLGADHIIEMGVDDPQGVLSTQQISEIEYVYQAERDDKGFRITVGRPHQVLPALIRLVADYEIGLTGLATRNATLEDVFIKLTGRHLSDEVERGGESQNGDSNPRFQAAGNRAINQESA